MSRAIIWPIGISFGLWLAWTLQFFILRYFDKPWDTEKLGQWGDSFGVLTALFTSAGFAAALYTLRLQQQQISFDRFDTTFFELFKLLLDARQKVKFHYSADYLKEKKSPGKIVGPGKKMLVMKTGGSGEDAFRYAWVEIKFWFLTHQNSNNNIISIYEKYVHERFDDVLGPYYRLLYTILKRIEKDKFLSEEEKNRYGNLIRSQLSGSEIAIMALNGLSPISADLDILITRFRLLKYTSGEIRTILQNLYPEEAFLPRD